MVPWFGSRTPVTGVYEFLDVDIHLGPPVVATYKFESISLSWVSNEPVIVAGLYHVESQLAWVYVECALMV